MAASLLLVIAQVDSFEQDRHFCKVGARPGRPPRGGCPRASMNSIGPVCG
jgi:hypothetical protein